MFQRMLCLFGSSLYRVLIHQDARSAVGLSEPVYKVCCVLSLWFRRVAQPGSAPLWGSGGRGFKSRHADGNPANSMSLLDFLFVLVTDLF